MNEESLRIAATCREGDYVIASIQIASPDLKPFILEGFVASPLDENNTIVLTSDAVIDLGGTLDVTLQKVDNLIDFNSHPKRRSMRNHPSNFRKK